MQLCAMILYKICYKTPESPYAISRKNVCEGASVFWMKSNRDNTPPWGKGGNKNGLRMA